MTMAELEGDSEIGAGCHCGSDGHALNSVNCPMHGTEARVKHMVDRFLMWKLPKDFSPDNGISFDPVASKGTPYESRREPVGTNLFSAAEADAMVRYMLEGMPAA